MVCREHCITSNPLYFQDLTYIPFPKLLCPSVKCLCNLHWGSQGIFVYVLTIMTSFVTVKVKGYFVLGVLCWARVIFSKDGMFWTSLCWTDSVGRKVLGIMLLMQSVGQMLRHGKCWAVVILGWIFLQIWKVLGID